MYRNLYLGACLVSSVRYVAKGAGVRKGGRVPILVLVLFVDRGHERSCWWEDLIDKDEDRLVGGQLDALADDVDELADC